MREGWKKHFPEEQKPANQNNPWAFDDDFDFDQMVALDTKKEG